MQSPDHIASVRNIWSNSLNRQLPGRLHSGIPHGVDKAGTVRIIVKVCWYAIPVKNSQKNYKLLYIIYFDFIYAFG